MNILGYVIVMHSQWASSNLGLEVISFHGAA